VQFRIKPNTKLGKLLDALCLRQGIPPVLEQLQSKGLMLMCIFDDGVIDPDDTCSSPGIPDGATIRASFFI